MSKVNMPRWELTDPFGRGEIKHLCWELEQLRRKYNEQRVELEEALRERAKACDTLLTTLRREQARNDELNRRLGVCDKARASLGSKLAAALEENAKLRGDIHDDD